MVTPGKGKEIWLHRVKSSHDGIFRTMYTGMKSKIFKYKNKIKLIKIFLISKNKINIKIKFYQIY